jgi:hypothetical protein
VKNRAPWGPVSRRPRFDPERAQDSCEEPPAAPDAAVDELSRRIRLTAGNATRAAGGTTADDGRVSLSAATFQDLRSVGMSITQARRVLRAREAGALEGLADLDAVPGIPREQRRRLRQRLRD